MKKEELKVVARNKKATHEYFILETYEAGFVLVGTEIKSVRNTKVSIQDAYCEVIKQEMIIRNMHIAHYEKGNIFNHKEDRSYRNVDDNWIMIIWHLYRVAIVWTDV